MTYELLPFAEWYKVKDLLPGELPNPVYASIMVAKDGRGEIQGALVAEFRLHLEPLSVKTPFLIRPLYNQMEKLLKERYSIIEYWTTAPTGNLGRIATHLKGVSRGMAFSKVLRP